MVLWPTPQRCGHFVHDRLLVDSFLEESGKELKDDNYIKYSRELSELHENSKKDRFFFEPPVNSFVDAKQLANELNCRKKR